MLDAQPAANAPACPPAVQPIPASPANADTTGVRSKPAALLAAATALLPDLEAGRALDVKTLREAMSAAFGAGDTHGAWVWKDAYEAAELEPSAGTGMLAVMAECALGKRTDDARSGDPLHLNEIAAVRAGLLAGLFQDAPVTRHNAEFHRRLSAGPASHCGVDEPAVFGEPRGPAHPP